MLTREVMGVLALGVLWINTLLIVAAAGKELFALMARRRSMRALGSEDAGEGLVQGVVLRGDGPNGALACQRVEQVGRSAGGAPGPRGILFADRSFEGEIFGGAIELEAARGEREAREEREELVIAKARPAEVWLAQGALTAASSCPSEARFDEAFEDAKKARGFTRTVTASVEPGARVWVAVDKRRGPRDKDWDVSAPRHLSAMVSTVDPRAICGRNIALSIASIAGFLIAAAGLTAVALYPPRFGLVSTIGGALCFGLFLLIQPAGTALRDAVRLPNRAFLRGSWRR